MIGKKKEKLPQDEQHPKGAEDPGNAMDQTRKAADGPAGEEDVVLGKAKDKKVGAAEREKAVREEVEQLRARCQALEKEKNEILGKLQRLSADYANFQKRVPKQIADSIAYEREKFIKTVLPVLDNFDHTLISARSAEDVEVVIKGVEIVYDQMLDVLKSHGVEQISAVGQKFDPALHEAMMQRSEPDKEDNVVLEEFQKGYKLNGRVIRPSKVIVNRVDAAGKAGTATQETAESQKPAEQEQQGTAAEPETAEGTEGRSDSSQVE